MYTPIPTTITSISQFVYPTRGCTALHAHTRRVSY